MKTNKLNGKILMSIVAFVIILLCLSNFAQIEGNLIIKPEKIFASNVPGGIFEYQITLENTQEKEITVRVQGIGGNLSGVLPTVNKVWTKIKPKSISNLEIKGAIRKDAPEGLYLGEVLIESEGISYSIPVNLEIAKVTEEISLNLKIEPVKKEIKPGETLNIKTTIEKKGRKKIDGELEISLLSLDNSLIAVKKLSFSESTSTLIEFPITSDTLEGRYKILGNVYYNEAGLKKLAASDTVEISVHKPWTEIFTPILSQITPSKIALFLFILLVLWLFSFLFFYYRKEKLGRRRYLYSILKKIKFETLPKSGLRSGFIGRIAETNIKAFVNLDELKKHTLVAGATGSGKTIAAQILVEEALIKGASAVVFDPTAQWTGFLKKNTDPKILQLYSYFGMSVKQARNFKGNIHIVNDPYEKIKIKDLINPGEITIFVLNKLNSTELENFIVNTIDTIYSENLEESQELKLLLIYDEIHRILPKFGGTGKGLTWIERGVREFRKWGVGIILISQVLSDFVGEIKANIGTEIQMRARYEGDLNRIKLKYGEDFHRCVVKAAIGEGIIQNSEYNRGIPYFIKFRPPLHSIQGLDNETLEKYDQYTQNLDSFTEKINEIKKLGIDTFDIEIELKLASDNLKEGMFGVVDLYFDTLNSRISNLIKRLEEGKIKEEERAIISEWDEKKSEILKEYEEELRNRIKSQKEELEKRSEIIKKEHEEKLREIENKRIKLIEAEREKAKEVEEEKARIEKKAHVLELLSRYERLRILLRSDIYDREKEKLNAQKQELIELKEPLLRQIQSERMKSEEERERIIEDMKKEEEEITQSINRIEKIWDEIQEDEKRILTKDKELYEAEWKLIEKIKNEIREEIEKRKNIREQLMKEREKYRQEELKLHELELMDEYEKKREEKKIEERKKREEIKKEKDRLYEELRKIRDKWLRILDRSKDISEGEEKIKKLKEELKNKEYEDAQKMDSMSEENN
ncbi:MAG: DUF87 domain-containing protein [Candidatus Altiarchaeota archaeon]